MTLKHFGLIALAFVAGFAVNSLLHRGEAPPASMAVGASTTDRAESDRLRAEYEQRLARLQSQIQGAAVVAENSSSGAKLGVPSLERRYALFNELRIGSLEEYTRQEDERLIAAGFTPDRIEWLRRRAQELATEWRQTDDRLRQQGKFDANGTIAHLFDKDIELRNEIGDDEYSRYRHALGRGIGLNVAEALAGGIGARAGIKNGDQIVAYNGIRVFNLGELAPLMGKSATLGTTVAVDVVRDGMTIRLLAEGGDLRIVPTMPLYSPGQMDNRMRTDIESFRQNLAKNRLRE